MFADFFKLAFENLKHRKTRSWLTIIGVIIGISAIIALISLSQGMSYAIEDQFKSFGARNIRVIPGSLQGPPIGVTGLTDKDIDVVKREGFAEYVAPVVVQYGQIEFRNEKQTLITTGYDTKIATRSFQDIDLKTIAGRSFRSEDKKVVMLGYKAADEIFQNRIRINDKIAINGENYKVIGIFEKLGNNNDKAIYIPLDDARALFDLNDSVSAILVKVSEGYDMDKASEQLKKDLKKSRDNENFEVMTPKDIINRINSILGIMNLVLVSIAAISLLIGGLGIMNSMYTSVLERTREIGVMKSVGAKNRDILIIFIIESGLIGLVGGIFGVILGLGIAKMVEIIAAAAGFGLIKIIPNIWLILFGLSFAFCLGVTSGIMPAIRAANMKPVDSLRYE